MPATDVQSATLVRQPISQIRIRPQVRKRFDEAPIRELASSIEATGLQQPPLCRRVGEDIELIDGEMRVRALLLLGRTETDVLVVEGVDEVNALARQLVSNLKRTDLDPVEKAEGVRAFMERASITQEEAARRMGLSPSDISRALGILKLPETLRAQVAEGRIPADSAYQLSRISDPAKQAALASDVASKKLTRDALARKMKRIRRTEEAAHRGPSRVTAALGNGRAVTLTGTALSFDGVIEIMEQLISRARKARAQGLSLATFIQTLRDQATT